MDVSTVTIKSVLLKLTWNEALQLRDSLARAVQVTSCPGLLSKRLLSDNELLVAIDVRDALTRELGI